MNEHAQMIEDCEARENRGYLIGSGPSLTA